MVNIISYLQFKLFGSIKINFSIFENKITNNKQP